ncbi:hypothetical protein AURDEDRAFT_186587 [Auricularia subglabra TFB-10046 SS5]|uniref:BTB domain-containing protein n=1 Tax=Auricularia subglabra (strain TFB-10046 / SS5) TaxID=717982 RepID=J0LKF0_AURST|nr:hypothetical protein AURDEDRAFT_186587 [Auricularia subglabra TFB-10046 SS5]
MSQAHSISLDLAASNYYYDDSTVMIHVGQEVFKICRSRLTQRSPVFRELFGLPQPAPYPSPPLEDVPVKTPPTPLGSFEWDRPAVSLTRDPPESSELSEELVCAPPAENMQNPPDVPLPPSPSPSGSPPPPDSPVASSERSAPIVLISSPSSVEGSEPLVVHLHNDPDDFRHYLWAIHADFIDAEAFRLQPASPLKCAKLLGIASVAHMYEVTAMADHCVEGALAMLESQNFHIDDSLASRVIHTSRRWVDRPEVLSRARLILREAMRSQRVDILAAILIAEPLDDRELLGWGYYYLLCRGKEHWGSDARVRLIDRRRLLSGAFALATKWRDLCRLYNLTARGNSEHLAAWAIFDKISASYYSYGSSQHLRADIERNLYSFFDPDPWEL